MRIGESSRMKKIILILLFLIVGCEKSEPESNFPKRLDKIPTGSQWAGGVDGGHWIACKNNGGDIFFCEIFSQHDGEVVAKGNFLYRKVIWNNKYQRPEYVDVAENIYLKYKFFDGVVIHVKDDRVLIPHGEIDYPFGDNHGKKQFFEYGQPIGEEIQYEIEVNQ